MAGKILIIDDDRDITQIIRILLEGEGFETCTAYSGAQALASLDETVELIILDIMMDGMNGFEACHRIRESSYVPILFLSAMSGDSEKVAALMAGGDDYLCKPFSAAELTARVRSLLRRYRVYQGADRAEPERERLVLGMDNKVTVNGRTYTVPASVPCYNTQTKSWVTLTEARAYADSATLYVYQGVVRFLEVG